MSSSIEADSASDEAPTRTRSQRLTAKSAPRPKRAAAARPAVRDTPESDEEEDEEESSLTAGDETGKGSESEEDADEDMEAEVEEPEEEEEEESEEEERPKKKARKAVQKKKKPKKEATDEDIGPPLSKVLGASPNASAADANAGNDDEDDLLLCCLLEGRSYRDVVWRRLTWLREHAPAKLAGWQRRLGRENEDGAEQGRLFPVEYTRIDRVVASRASAEGEELLVKWCSRGYAHSTWEEVSALQDDDADAVARFRERWSSVAAAHPTAAAPKPLPALPARVATPTFNSGCMLREYQCESFDWMVRNALKGRNVILGDEMGLGKTAQAIAVMEHLRCQSGWGGPFLVVAPLSTLTPWQREITKWTGMNAVVYSGTKADKAMCVQYEFWSNGGGTGRGRRNKREKPTFDVLLISYETLRDDARLLGGVKWGAVVADEAHRLKGAFSRTSVALKGSFTYKWLLMLIGTPVQNNVTELWGLLYMLDEAAFPSIEDFESRFCLPGGQPDATRISQLAAALRPYLLRRMKEDVEELPEKEEVVVWVEMTADQRGYYKALHERNIGVLLAANSKKNLPSSRNLLIELRHCCNHPFVLKGIQEDFTRRKIDAASASGQPPPSETELRIAASGKFLLLSKLLPKLKADGHKVLIFTQFLSILDLLQDMCDAEGWSSERLDGSTPAAARQAGIDRFNGSSGNGFLYLLSTRAGGMGITLTAADVAIIFDSDWNPQIDLQAMARCHRIGQTKAVRVYRLVTRGTAEECLLKSANRKQGLEEALLGTSSGGDGDECEPKDTATIQRLLNNGAVAMSEAAEAEGARFCAEGIEEILARRVERRQIGSRKGNLFSTARFADDEGGPSGQAAPQMPAAAVAQGASQPLPAADWAAMMPEAAAAAAAAAAAGPAYLGRRVRTQVDYRGKDAPDEDGDVEMVSGGEDKEFSDAGAVEEDSTSSGSDDLSPKAKARARKKAAATAERQTEKDAREAAKKAAASTAAAKLAANVSNAKSKAKMSEADMAQLRRDQAATAAEQRRKAAAPAGGGGGTATADWDTHVRNPANWGVPGRVKGSKAMAVSNAPAVGGQPSEAAIFQRAKPEPQPEPGGTGGVSAPPEVIDLCSDGEEEKLTPEEAARQRDARILAQRESLAKK